MLADWLVAALALAAPGETPLANPSFEAEWPAGAAGPPGWTTVVGVAEAPEGPESLVALDLDRRSLRLSGDASTRRWRVVYQDVPAAAWDRVRLDVATRAAGVVRDADRQFENAGVALQFLDAAGKTLAGSASPRLDGDRGWEDVRVEAVAPVATAKARVVLVLSLTGTLGFDDVRLAIERLPEPTPPERAAALDALETHLLATYPYADLPGKPAVRDLFARRRAAALAAPDRDAFVAAVRDLLAELSDVHVWIEAPSGRIPTAPAAEARGIANWNEAIIRRSLDPIVIVARGFLVGRIRGGGPGYVRITTLSLSPSEERDLEISIDRLAEAPSLVIDVRSNPGGSEPLARRIAERFVGEERVYAKHRFRDPARPLDPAAFGPEGERSIGPRARAARDGRPIALLQGPRCLSSAEGFVLMLRGLPGVTTVGLPTGGASGNPAPFELLPGVRVMTSRWRDLLPGGTPFEGKGIEPSVRVDEPAEAYRTADPTLAKGIEVVSAALRERSGSR